MKLDLDCVRDLLIYVEQFDCLDEELKWQYLDIEEIFEEFPHKGKYSNKQIVYTILKLSEAEIITETHQSAGDGIYYLAITSLTYFGHEYLEKIRDEERWKKVKKIGHAVKDFSIEAIGAIAEGITSAAISKQLNP